MSKRQKKVPLFSGHATFTPLSVLQMVQVHKRNHPDPPKKPRGGKPGRGKKKR